ncbi:MAG: outer membrane receptor for ferrienterochelin and colicins [Bradymonadia bacterium]|jgi:outer membrane receptor for ferrienterochelin and colicins
MLRACTWLLLSALPAAAQPPAPTPADDTIVVTGTRTETRLADTPIETEVIDRDRLERSGARSVGEALQSAGLALPESSFAGQGAGLQGLSGRQVLVLVDGERVTGQVDGITDLSQMRTEHIERVEIVRGSGSSVYGADAMGGVINIITRRGRRTPQAQIDLAGATDAAVDASGLVSGGIGPVKGRLSVGWHRAEAFDLEPADIGTTGSALRDTQVGSRVDIDLGKGATLDLGADWALRRRVGVDARDTGAILDRALLDESIDGRVGLRWKSDGGTRLRLTAHGQTHRSQFVLNQRGADALDVYEDNRFRRADVHGSVTTSVAGSHALTVGVDGIFEDAQTPRIDGETASRLRGAVYIQDEWTLFGKPYAVLVAGARVDVDEWFGAQPTPRVAVRYDPVEQIELRASVGVGYRAPDLKEMFLRFENPGVGYTVSGAPDLAPESSLSTQLGVRWRPDTHWMLRANLFRHAIDDLISIQPLGDNLYAYANVDSAVSQGVETELNWQPLAALQVLLGYVFTDARDLRTDEVLPGRPTHRGYVEVTARTSGGGVDVTARCAVNGARPFYDEDGKLARTSPALAIAAARASVSITDDIRLFARAENLFDAADIDAAPIRPRRIGLGLTGRF